MTDKDEKLKPPARRPRPKGRVLGAAKKTASAPPPPPELTREQLADDSVAKQPPLAAVADAEPRSTTAAVPPRDRDDHAVPAAPQAVAPQESGEVRSVTEDSEPVGRAPDVRPYSRPGQHSDQVTSEFSAPNGQGPVAGEVAVRQEVLPPAGSTEFPVRPPADVSRNGQSAGSGSVSSDGTAWAQGPGRPRDIPEAAVVLNQRIITRESLDASVPAVLKLKKRLKRLALDNELDHLPIGDIVCVALDEWLTNRGF